MGKEKHAIPRKGKKMKERKQTNNEPFLSPFLLFSILLLYSMLRLCGAESWLLLYFMRVLSPSNRRELRFIKNKIKELFISFLLHKKNSSNLVTNPKSSQPSSSVNSINNSNKNSKCCFKCCPACCLTCYNRLCVLPSVCQKIRNFKCFKRNKNIDKPTIAKIKKDKTGSSSCWKSLRFCRRKKKTTTSGSGSDVQVSE